MMNVGLLSVCAAAGAGGGGGGAEGAELCLCVHDLTCSGQVDGQGGHSTHNQHGY